MAEETAPSSSAEKSEKSIDLDALSGLNFGPDWADDSAPKRNDYKRFEERGAPKGKGRRPSPGSAASSRDRRSGGRPQGKQGERSGRQGERGEGRSAHGSRDQRRGAAAPEFKPTVKVDLFPQDEAFEALVKRLRASARTYQLFEIAHLLLEKPERFVVVVSPMQRKQDAEASSPLLYFSVPAHLPFESEEQAINYVMKEHLDVFFDIEEIEVEPPKGNFVMVNRCGITNELLGPPNYHRYQEFVQRHYAARISGMSLERFQSKIVGSKEQEDVDAWLESMKKGARYKLKEPKEGEPESFDTLEAARRFLLTHRKDQLVGSGESVRFAGRDIERLPKGDIRRSVELHIEEQRHFPLDSANNIRGRLRRHKFAVYKKGSKGVSFVCAVKRKFRDSKSVFTDSIRDLIEFIEKHPNIPASKLSKEYIGIDTERQKPAVLEMKESVDGAAAKDAAADDVAADDAAADDAATDDSKDTQVAEAHEVITNPEPGSATPQAPVGDSAPEEAPKDAEISEASSTQPVEVADVKTEATEAPSEETPESTPAIDPTTVEASTEAKPKAPLSEAEQKQLNQLMLDLRWLITEGYVTEYGDGRLFAPPPLPEPSKKKVEPTTPRSSKKEEAKPEHAATPTREESATDAKKVADAGEDEGGEAAKIEKNNASED